MIIAIILFVISEVLVMGLLVNNAPVWLIVTTQSIAFSSGTSMAIIYRDVLDRIKKLEEKINKENRHFIGGIKR